jgi:hypothetical protein
MKFYNLAGAEIVTASQSEHVANACNFKDSENVCPLNFARV